MLILPAEALVYIKTKIFGFSNPTYYFLMAMKSLLFAFKLSLFCLINLATLVISISLFLGRDALSLEERIMLVSSAYMLGDALRKFVMNHADKFATQTII